MLSNHKIQVALEEIKEISRTDLALYDDKGKQIAATFEPEPEICMAIGNFMDSMAESQMLSGCHFFTPAFCSSGRESTSFAPFQKAFSVQPMKLSPVHRWKLCIRM